MQLPFSREELLDVFGAYNTALWPALVTLWVASLYLAVLLVRRGRVPGRAISALLALHWGWSGIAYHAMFFSSINPSAWLFAALFFTEGLLVLRRGVFRDQLQFSRHRSIRHWLAGGLVAYSLVYPIVVLADDLILPRARRSASPARPPFSPPGFSSRWSACPGASRPYLSSGRRLVVRQPSCSVSMPMWHCWSAVPLSSPMQRLRAGLREQGRLATDQVRTRVEEVLGFIGLRDYLERLPSQLSGGQRRRVAIARTMAAQCLVRVQFSSCWPALKSPDVLGTLECAGITPRV